MADFDFFAVQMIQAEVPYRAGLTHARHTYFKQWLVIRKGSTMRFVQAFFLAIMFMVPFRIAHADTPAICETIAVNFANASGENAEEWLTRY